MEPNMEEALKAKANAERRFVEKDFLGAKNYALKAQMLYPHLEGISQMVATFGVLSAAETKINGEYDFYAILGLDSSVDKAKLKKQYKKMAVLLHPDKNKSVGADGAFRLVSEAWTVLSDGAKRSSYDHRRSLVSLHGSGVGSYDSYSNSSVSHNRLDTFWTVCTSCHVQYEYLRKYLNKRLSCKNCRGVFIAVETGLAPVNGSYSYSSWSNGYGSHGCGATYVPTTSVYPANNGVSGHHSGPCAEHVSNLSFQWSSCPGNSAAVLDSNGSSTAVSFANQASRKITRRRGRGKHELKKVVSNVVLNGHAVCNEQIPRRPGRPPKKIKIGVEGTYSYSNGEVALKTAGEVKMADGNGDGNLKQNVKLPNPAEASVRRSAAPAFDARRLLIDKARAEIRKKLEEIKLASETAAAAETEKRKADAEFGESSERPKRAVQESVVHQSELGKTGSMTIVVPDSDFHDFDKDRSEDCFRPKQIWALYDEEDGMPRLYCLIREIISVKPFKVHISYLSSKTDSEFGLVNWLDSGFTKSCGNFRAFNSEIVEHVNIFSHLLNKEKVGRGGCIRIYPKSGDIWAVYRNWSPDWNRTTPAEVRHQYEMVEVLDDYSEELGVCVTPLVKLDGFKTVYSRNTNKDAIRLIPRREMLRFSHQVPSCLLKGERMNLPEGSWDLDPAAIPEDLLQQVNDVKEERPTEAESLAGFDLNVTSQAETKMLMEEKFRQSEYPGDPDELHGTGCGLQIQDISSESQNLFRISAELPQSVKEVHSCEEPSRMENFSATPGEHFRAVTEV